MYPEFKSVNKLFEKTFRENWDRPAISNYNGLTLLYKDLSRRIAELHIVYEKCGLKKGDKVAICGKNQANWAVAFMSVLTYGAVPVPLLHEFKPGNIHHLVTHSESKVLFVDDQIWENLNEKEMPTLVAAVQLSVMNILYDADGSVSAAMGNLMIDFNAKYPYGFTPECVEYYEDKEDELAIINYTSGTSGFSKGVMLPYRSLWSNLDFAKKVHGHMCPGTNIISILPSAHMYGLMFEFLYQLSRGVHIHFLTRIPSPKIILQAMSEVKPDLIIAVPLIIEKIYKNMLKPELEKENIKTMRKWLPGFELLMMGIMKKQLIEAFGGQFDEIIIGGAAFNREVETFFHKMKFPFTVGYGMTECGPIITYSRWDKAKVGSSGKVVPHMEIKIDSPDPENVPGEIMCRGANVFQGYFKNEESTQKVFTQDGWFRTGDMGVMDKDGYLFIKGRNKCMILGPSGQNIYPEELETVLNNLQYVVDTLVIDDKNGLTALVYPDLRAAEQKGLGKDELEKLINEQIMECNKEFPNYSQIKNVEIMPEDFERTPKKSIKRYLYQR